MKKVLTLTMNPAVDINTGVEHVVAERKLRCDPVRLQPGGGGINVSRALKRIGGDSLAVYTSGGAIGETLAEMLEEEGIRRHPVPISGRTRENFIVYETSTGQQYRFGTPGPELEADEWRQCLDDLEASVPQGGFIVASGSLPAGVPDDFYRRVIRIGAGGGARVVIDTSGAALREALGEGGAYLIKPNLRELGLLVGEELDSEQRQEQAALKLIQEGRSNVVVVSLGAAGALVASDEGIERFRAPTVRIKSKVGAGDSMVAGLVYGLASERSLRESVMLGVAAGAAAVKTPGTELCRGEDVEKLYRDMLSRERGERRGQ